MRKHPFILNFLALGLMACPSIPTRPVLNAVGGSYQYQTTPGKSETKIGSAFAIQLRSSTNQRLTANAGITIRGPTRWNNDQVLKLTYPSGSDWVLLPQSEIAPVAGNYSVEASGVAGTSGEPTSVNFSIGGAQSMPLTTIVLSDISRTSVTGEWTNLEPAQSYIARIYNGTDAVFLGSPNYLKTTSASFIANAGEFDLSPTKTNVFVVYALNFDATAEKPTFPSELQVSDSASFIDAQGLGAKSVNRISARDGLLVKR
jgi:hypothetical protein